MRVAQLPTQGDSLAHISKQSGVSVFTMRNPLRSIFEKTGTHRQAALVGLLLRSQTSNAQQQR